MIEPDKPNPFQVLQLRVDATKREIVERGRELYDTAETEEQRQLYSWAKEQLLSKPSVRLEYELFEAPETQYEDIELDNFMRQYKKLPISPDALLRDAPLLNKDDVDIARLIELLLQDVLTVPEGDINVPLHMSSYKPEPKPPLEVRDVLFG